MMWLINNDGTVRGPRSRTTRRAHPSLGPCTDCRSEQLRPIGDAAATVAVRCETCGLVLSIEEHSRLRAAVEGVPTLQVLR